MPCRLQNLTATVAWTHGASCTSSQLYTFYPARTVRDAEITAAAACSALARARYAHSRICAPILLARITSGARCDCGRHHRPQLPTGTSHCLSLQCTLALLAAGVATSPVPRTPGPASSGLVETDVPTSAPSTRGQHICTILCHIYSHFKHNEPTS